MKITLDSKYDRVFFTNGTNTKNEIINLNATEVCNEHEVNLHSTLTEIYEPIEMLMEITIIKLNEIPQEGSEFCSNCLMFKPEETATVRSKVQFVTGCNGAQCVSNLILEGTFIDVTDPYVKGSTKEIEIEYEITNSEENAYLTQLMISIPTNVTEFKTIPSNCKLSNMDSLMTCSILNGNPIMQNETTKLLIKLDMSFIQGSNLRVNASVTCAGINQNKDNNSIENTLELSAYSNIVMTSENSDPDILIDKDLGFKEITYSYKISNLGPSSVDKLTIVIPVPIKYVLEKNELTIVDIIQGPGSCQYADGTFNVLTKNHNTHDTRTFYTGNTANQSVITRAENKTIYFNCSSATIICKDVEINIEHFKSDDDFIDITLLMSLNMNNIGKCNSIIF